MEEKKSLKQRMNDAAEALRDGRAADALRDGGTSLGSVIADGANAVVDGRVQKKLAESAQKASELGSAVVDGARKVVGSDAVEVVGKAGSAGAAHAVKDAAVLGASVVVNAADAVAHSEAGQFVGDVASSLGEGLKDSVGHLAHGVSDAAHTLGGAAASAAREARSGLTKGVAKLLKAKPDKAEPAPDADKSQEEQDRHI